MGWQGSVTDGVRQPPRQYHTRPSSGGSAVCDGGGDSLSWAGRGWADICIRAETGDGTQKGGRGESRANLRPLFSCLLIYQSHTAITKKAFLVWGKTGTRKKERQRLQEPAPRSAAHSTYPPRAFGRASTTRMRRGRTTRPLFPRPLTTCQIHPSVNNITAHSPSFGLDAQNQIHHKQSRWRKEAGSNDRRPDSGGKTGHLHHCSILCPHPGHRPPLASSRQVP